MGDLDLGTAVSSHLPALLAAAAALTLIVLGVVATLVVRARQSAGGGGWTDSSATVVDFSNDPGALAIAASFERAVQLLGQMPGGSRYALPWYLMIGGSSPGNAELLRSLPFVLPFGQPDPGPAPISWWIYENAVVIEAAAAADPASVGGASDPASWQHLLHCLRETRPARPLDGLVVVIPVADLTDAALPDGSSALAERASFLGDRATDLVAKLGFRLPTDVLVSGCEELPGFARFVASVPPSQWQGIFGWANPNPLTAAYTPDWAAQAMAYVVRGVDRQELAFFGTPQGTGDAAAQLYPFARAVRGLAEPVAAYLNHLFTLSAAAEPCFFRGLSFCGEPGEAVPDDAGRTAFAGDLFAQKVFPERALARPASDAATGRRKALRALQALAAAAVVAMVAGLALGPGDVAAKVAPLLPWLDKVAARLPGGTTPQEPGDRELLRGMNDIPGYGVKTWGLPASWLSGVNGRVRDSLTVAATRIFLPDERGGLLARRSSLVAGRTPRERPPSPPYGLPDGTPEFYNLNQFGVALDTMEGQVGGYDGFLAGASADDRKPASRLAAFESLASYALGVQLAPTDSAARSLGDALARVALPAQAAIPLTADPEVQGRAQALVSRMYEAAFQETYVRRDVDRLVQLLDTVGHQSSTGATDAELRLLLAEINRTQQDLTRSDQAWIAGASYPASPAYNAMLGELQSSAWLGSGYSRNVQAQGSAGFYQMQKELAAASSPYTGPILAQQNGKIQLQLSPGVLELQSVLQGLFNQPFVPNGRPQPWLACKPGQEYLMWDSGTLSTGPPIIQSYQDFLQKGLALFPPSLQQQVALVARQQTSIKIHNVVASAESCATAGQPLTPALLETQVQGEVQNLSAATTPLGQILTSSRQLSLTYDYPGLAALVGSQSVGILGEVSRLLRESRLYVPQDRSFSTWNGQSPPAPAAFGAADENGLKNYLSTQRARATQLNTSYAQPTLATVDTVKSFDPRIVENPAVLYWKRIATVLSQYGQQTAGNSLADLEEFISTPMSEMTVATCRNDLAGTPEASRGDDFFQAQEGSLASALSARCGALVVRDGRADYCILAASFHRELENQYPFAVQDPGQFGPSAQPAAIARFFAVYDNRYAVIDQVPTPDLGANGQEIKAFMAQLAQVRTLFASFLKQPDTPPTWNFNVTFRTNRGQEVGGNQILTWTIQSGDQQISVTNPFQSATPPAGSSSSSASSAASSGSGTAAAPPSTPDSAATSTGQWSFGQPANVVFGWAKDSPWQPRPTGQQPHVAVSGGNVTYEYGNNPWSLFSLLRDHATSPAAGPQQTLQFAVATQPVLQGAVAQNGATTVFLRLQLQTPDDKKAVTVPTVFPTKAPALSYCGQAGAKRTAAR